MGKEGNKGAQQGKGQGGKLNRLKAILFGLMVMVLLLPLIQEQTGAIPRGELAGVEVILDTIPLNKSTWISGEFQKNFEQRHYRWMGLRPSMVRLRNQLEYSLFGENYRSIMVGEGGELFRRGSMKAIRGLDYIGDEQIKVRSNHVAYIHQHFAQRGVRMLVLFTPSKLRCMPEALPGYELEKPYQNNYSAFLKEFAQYPTDLIDFTPILKNWVETEQHPVFPRTGTHWTDYGAALAAQHLISEMEKRSGENYVDFRIRGFEQSDEMRDTDADAGDLLNLVFDLPPKTVAYPQIEFSPSAGYKRPKVLVISDSFWWKIYNQDIHKNVFAPGSQFRYYNYEVFSDQWEDAKLIGDFDFQKTVEGVEWVILCTNEGNFHKFPFNFTDQMLQLYYPQALGQ